MDVVTMACMYLVVLLAFGSGIIFMGNKKIKAKIKCHLSKYRTLGHQPLDLNSQNEKIWTNFWKTVETMFWSLLGPGEEFKNKDDQGVSTDLVSEQGPFSLGLMGIYQIISAVIFMNLLIAIMNTTMQEVHNKKLLYWKFVRAGIWLRFFDESRALPPPYNLANFVTLLKTFIIDRVFRRNVKKNSEQVLICYKNQNKDILPGRVF